MSRRRLTVGRPTLPPLEEFIPLLEEIWSSEQLTNSGQMHQRLERQLEAEIGARHVCLTANGTLAMALTFAAMDLDGEVITTPFSFVASAHALTWQRLTPVFVDIDPETLNIDTTKIEAAITPRTKAILAVHAFGNPCDVAALKLVAERRNLRLIFDAAHSMGTRIDQRSVLVEGHASIVSFHATKVMSTLEGGAVVTNDDKLGSRIRQMRNFGIAVNPEFCMFGINAKMSEMHAAMGLLQLSRLVESISCRKWVYDQYRAAIGGTPGLRLVYPSGSVEWNYAYAPLIIEGAYHATRDQVFDSLARQGIQARKYFFPLISDLPPYRTGRESDEVNLARAQDCARRVLCLPIHPDMNATDIKRVVEAIQTSG